MSTQCPDRQLLSVYFDGELPSPWKEKMEAHIAGCAQCAQHLTLYRDFSLVTDEDVDAAQKRVWQKLEQGAALTAPLPRSRPMSANALWRRRISIPLPAAAAIAVIVMLAFLLVLRITGTGETADMTLASGTAFDTPGIIPVSDDAYLMENVLQYLGSRDSSEILIIRLPESRNFVNYGEPAILRAADYSRQVTSRQMTGRRKH
ncbi:MAG: zf-HC2 domain-containing protein [Treponema sp.]|nr:zf-HC2 domain-containing protein [Treponema sp.]